MTTTIDIKRAHLSRQHGDILVIFTWVNDERAMVLVPAFRKGAPWFIIMETASYTWDDSVPANVPQVVRKSMKACEVLGIEPSPTNCRRIAGIIIDGLPDLIRMPTSQPPEQHSANFGKLQLRADGKVVSEQDIKLDKEGATYGS